MRKILSLSMAMGLAVVGGAANALTMTTDAAYTVNAFDHTSSTFVEVTDQDGPNSAPSGSLSSFVNYGFGGDEIFAGPQPGIELDFLSNGYASGHASESGNLAVRTEAKQYEDVQDMAFHASSIWSETVTNTNGADLDYFFDFTFTGGYIGLGDHGGMAKISLDILVNGVSLYDRYASLIGDPENGTHVFSTNFDPDPAIEGYSHYPGAPGNPNTDANIFGFDRTLDLGTILDGESFTLTYVMEAWSTTGQPGSRAVARAGDPFNFSYQGGFTSAPPSAPPIPEPTSMALMGLGLLGFGARRLRKNVSVD